MRTPLAALFAGLLAASPAGAQGVEALMKLMGPEWRLASLDGAPVEPGAHLIFTNEGRLHGRGGCNGLNGAYIARDDGAFLAGRIASTMMACPEPQMKLEQAFHEALQAARGWRLDGGRLVLIDVDGAELAALEAAPI